LRCHSWHRVDVVVDHSLALLLGGDHQ